MTIADNIQQRRCAQAYFELRYLTARLGVKADPLRSGSDLGERTTLLKAYVDRVRR